MSFQRLSTIIIFPNAVVLAKTLLGNLTTIVLKTRPDRPVRPGASPVQLKPPKLVNNRSKTWQKPGLNRKFKKKKRFDAQFGF